MRNRVITILLSSLVTALAITFLEFWRSVLIWGDLSNFAVEVRQLPPTIIFTYNPLNYVWAIALMLVYISLRKRSLGSLLAVLIATLCVWPFAYVFPLAVSLALGSTTATKAAIRISTGLLVLAAGAFLGRIVLEHNQKDTTE
jgi:hypothetical protein